VVEHGAGVGGFELAEGKVVGGDDGNRMKGDPHFGQSVRASLLVAGVGAAQDLVEHNKRGIWTIRSDSYPYQRSQ
jgi:hypothetical protein